jgi:hypothetical protein
MQRATDKSSCCGKKKRMTFRGMRLAEELLYLEKVASKRNSSLRPECESIIE